MEDQGLQATAEAAAEATGHPYEAVQSLAEMPDVHNVKALKKHQYGYRLRVGNYRVLFDWDGGIRIVQIQEVRKRDERTY
ncbi:type II toxin-antitoxin system RelE family toxin [Salinicola corii]|uniref:type II toxin-antitoxin system RelE family toxin n=1 Tax=Salinicola corii TaxID=2606937 RepID=UPI001CA9530A|nr:type II toxin-antitoxin system RelE/ParE family toxin [Salinicola corii]